MNTAIELKAERYKLMQKCDSLMKSARTNKQLLPEADLILDEISALDGRILLAEQREAGAVEKAGRVFSGMQGARGTGTDSSLIFANLARGMKHSNAADVPENIRALTSTSGSTMIQDPTVSDEILFALMANNELVEAGMQMVQIENYKSIPKVTAYPAVIWQDGEGTEITVDASLAIGSVKWTLHDMAIRVRVSNQLLMDSSDRAKRIIQESMRRAIQDGIAKAVFTGSGTNGEPLGIEGFTGTQTVAGGSNTLNSWTFIIQALAKLAAVNVPLSKVSAFFSPTVWSQIAEFQVAGQSLAMPDLLSQVKFFSPTNLIPETYDTNTSTIMVLGDFSKLIVGFQGAFELTLDQTRAHHLETEFLIHMRVDIQATHEDNFVVIEDITLA